MTCSESLLLSWRAPIENARLEVFGGGLLARSGGLLSLLDAETGAVGWQRPVCKSATRGSWFLYTDGRVVLGQGDDVDRAFGRIVATRLDGSPVWERVVRGASLLGTKQTPDGMAFLDEGAIRSIGFDGSDERHPLPSPGRCFSYLSDGTLVVSGGLLASTAPQLYIVRDGAMVVAPDVGAVVHTAYPCGDSFAALEIIRANPGHRAELVARDRDLAVRWRYPATQSEYRAVDGTLWMTTGDEKNAVPVQLDLATGQELWRGEPMGDSVLAVRGNGPVLAYKGCERTVLFALDGTLVETIHGYVCEVHYGHGHVFLSTLDEIVALRWPGP